ncbi:PHP domain-containing protein [Synechococcales cyanobacterium C]|uniref:PHP domain-containing protein n=1 Tax=Petrachloros mirabilis ULC683 TaxID=2781853 RepID=A0A8K2A7T9_9CYAN|nr:PHP domain-containing protein [Petrachloros mirabilis]NCJ07266.1 PHP domain-containing protein [Petrachloros mirabilis ULC683]
MTLVSTERRGTTATLKTVFQDLQADSCPYLYNFHLHTVFSDGQLHPDRLMQQAVAHGLEGLAITDHHTVAGYRAAHLWLESLRSRSAQAEPLPQLWSGIEINANLTGVEVHILGYGFDCNHPVLYPYTQGTTALGKSYEAEQVIAAIQGAGGIAILAHPARYRHPASDLVAAAVTLGIDGLETYYCYANQDPWQPSATQTQDMLTLGQRYSLLKTCGTDTHGSSILRRL